MTPNSEMGGICLVKEHSMGPVSRETYPTGEFIYLWFLTIVAVVTIVTFTIEKIQIKKSFFTIAPPPPSFSDSARNGQLLLSIS
jgi:hypothetical protein